MEWFKSLKNLLPSKLTQSKSFYADVSGTNGIFSVNNPQVLSREGYILNSCVHSCIDLIISAILQNDLYVCNIKDDQNEPITNDLTKLLEKPDPDEDEGIKDWEAEYFAYILLFGNSFIYKIAPSMGLNVGKPQMLKVMSQYQIDVITKTTAFGNVLDRYQFKNSTIPIDPKDMLHGKKFNPENQVIGLPPLMACGLNVDLINEVNRWNIALLQNGVNPSGVYTVEGTLTKLQQNEMKIQLDTSSGSKNAGKQKILQGGMKYQQTGMSPKDTDFNNGVKFAKREVASVYNIAPQLIGDTESQTFANYTQAILSLHNDVAYPLLNGLVTRLNNWIVPFYGKDLVIKIDNSKVQAIQEQKKAEWDKIDKSNELTINEKRRMKGQEAIENGDFIIINGQTLEQIIAGQQSVIPTFGKQAPQVKTLNKIDVKEYLEIQQKAITKNEDRAISESVGVLADYFQYQIKEIKKNLEGINNTSQMNHAVDSVIQQTTPALKEVYNIIYKDIAFDYVLKARKDYKEETFKRIGLEKKETNRIEAAFDILKNFKEEFGSYVDNYFDNIKLKDLIIKVNDETKAMIISEIEFGTKEGLDINAITKNIQGVYDNDMTQWRSERIARTETLRGMSFASHESQKKIDPTAKQKWLTTHDDRTRPTSPKGEFNHRNVDMLNGNIGLNDFFRVSNEKLQFPRDSSLGASAGNVINCRCSVGYIDEEFAEFFT
jgi:HK97 family phage portal protein